jgi:Cytochrome c/c1 heme lyase
MVTPLPVQVSRFSYQSRPIYILSHFSTEPPFDRHDWIVQRAKTGEQVRYVIDYYSAPPESDGSPVFSLDVRPALDSFWSVKERVAVATEDMWATFRNRDQTMTSPRRQ